MPSDKEAFSTPGIAKVQSDITRMLLPPLFIVVEVVNVLFSLIIGLFSMIFPLFWSTAFNWSADFSYDLPPRRSLLTAFPCGLPPSVRQLSTLWKSVRSEENKDS